MSQLLDQIIQWQREIAAAPPSAAPSEAAASHVLALGCVDARINTRRITKSDGKLLFPNGKSPVRNIAARAVGPNAPDGKEEAETLRRAIEGDGVSRIVIMGHTCCGGINACYHSTGGPALRKYLSSLDGLCDQVKKGEGSDAQKLRELEARSVLDSAANLRKHKVVRDAEAKGKLVIETYLLDTGTQQAIDLGKGEDYSITKEAPEHKPEMLVVCSRDAHLFPQDDLNIGDGKALIYRTRDGLILGEKRASRQESAIIEFALANGVKDIVVLGKTCAGESADMRLSRQALIAQSVSALNSYPGVCEAQKKGVAVHGWVVEETSRLIRELDKNTAQFIPMGRDEFHPRRPKGQGNGRS